MKIISLFFILLLPGIAQAVDDNNSTRSAGKFVNDKSIQLAEKIKSTPVIDFVKNPINLAGPEQQSRLAGHGVPVYFEIFDAWVDLSGDLDDDGYYHNIRVTFDADVNTEVETVYAKLYLSRDGGPWYHYTTSDLFEIHYDSADDTFEILTELIEGYEPGYYEVRIELHSLFHTGIVASRILGYHDVGFDITLEDLQHDELYREENETYIESYSYGVSGSFSVAGLIMLGLLLSIKTNYFNQHK